MRSWPKKNALSFMWYTDGIRIFNSSKNSIWGFFLVILELAYGARYKVENILLVGLWFGEKKPNPNIFLEPLKKSLRVLYRGIKVFVDDLKSYLTIRGLIICGTGDLPAKALFLCMNQYNGRFGCQFCKEEGCTVERTRIYPHKNNLRLRTDGETLEHASQALEFGKPVCGVKGPTIMSKICHKFVSSTAVDVMHCVFEGVAKRLGELWFDAKYADEDFSIYNLVEVVDYRLCNIAPPSYTARRPRPIKTHFCHWKASELKNWFFYYSIPVLAGILPDKYIDHYKLLVLAIYLLSQQSVSRSMINLAETLLREFCSRFESLYGLRNMSCNLHSLRHLPEVVRRTGPLWTTSCFPLEDLNGKLKALSHGSNSPHLQIASNLNMYIIVYTLRNEWLKENSDAFNYCETLSNPMKRLKLTRIDESLYIVGSISKLNTNESQQIMNSNNLPGTNIFLFKKLYKNKMLYSSLADQKNKKTKSFFVKYEAENSISHLGAIQKFIRVTNCECKKFCDCPGMYFAIIKRFNHVNPFYVNIPEQVTLNFIHQCTDDSETIEIINVNNLKCVCYYILFDNNICFAIEPVNTLESE